LVIYLMVSEVKIILDKKNMCEYDF